MTVAKCKPTTQRPGIAFVLLGLLSVWTQVWAAEGKWTVSAVNEAEGTPIVARIELTRPTIESSLGRPASRMKRLRKIKPLPGRTTVEAGYGFVIDGPVELKLSEGAYQFRVSRGPEYRVISGNSTIEKTSADEHTFALPRILDMQQYGWTSGDCFVPASRENLPIRMTAEDLHVAATTAQGTSSDKYSDEEIAGLRGQRQRHELPPLSDPLWIRQHAQPQAGLVFYAADDHTPPRSDADPRMHTDVDLAALHRLASLASQRRSSSDVEPEAWKVAIEDPFAWPLPVYLASGQVDGFFVLGDWLRLDRSLLQSKTGRPFPTKVTRNSKSLGREAEQITWELLDAGFRLAPLAGSGDEGGLHPVGYNRLYVAGETADSATMQPRPVDSAAQWWSGAWAGRSFATNGPLLIANLDGKLPGHVFQVDSGNPALLKAELTLTVQDPVDYLEVIYNGQIHYSAKLDEYAKAGGKIPPLRITRSGWALIRVVTLYEDHFRAATTAPWYFEVDGKPRITRSSVEVFQQWLADYETHLRSQPAVDLQAYAPFIRSARDFWQGRLESANAN
tara:strand:+ start:282 stop:1967 length:1686 start_codon:yes stop_codon:yes gene_type:complete